MSFCISYSNQIKQSNLSQGSHVGGIDLALFVHCDHGAVL